MISRLLLLLPALAYSQLLKDRSVQCTRDTMDVSLSFYTPFHGSVFTEGAPPGKACRWFGSGRHALEASIPLRSSNISEDCGVIEDQKTGAFVVKLVVSPVDGLLVDGFTALNVRCVYASDDITLTLPAGADGKNALIISGAHDLEAGVVTGSGGAPMLSMQILDGHGLDGNVLQKAAVGQRLTLDLVLKDTAIYDFYVHSCYAHDGTNSPDASINIVDQFGCAVRLARAIDAPVMVSGPVGGGPKHVFVHMYGFQFTSSHLVYFECQVRPCVHSCEREQCVDPMAHKQNELLMSRKKRDHEMSPLHLKTVLEITPQHVKRAALVSQKEATPKYCVDLMTLLFISGLFLLTLIITSVVIFFACHGSGWPRKLSRTNSSTTYSTANLEHIRI